MATLSPLVKAYWRQALLLLLIGFFSGCSSSYKDISPDMTDPTTGGLTIALAGSKASLFAVSLNAGLWHSRAPESGDRVWIQSPEPRYTHCVAVDPAQPSHVVAGDREGDAQEPRLNEAGLYESFNGGNSFTYAWNPVEMSGTGPFGRCPSQVVQAVAFSASSSIIVATPCGIARRPKGASDFTPSTLPANTETLTNLVSSESKIWARTENGLLLLSTDDGISFDTATHQPLPSGTLFFWEDTGDASSLAASDRFVIMSACCITSGPGPVNEKRANELLIYDVDKDRWRFETFLDGNGKTSTSGTYLGGRRFVRSFQTNNGVRYIFSNGQNVWECDLVGKHTLLATSGVDFPGTPLYTGFIHNDFWDFLIDRNGADMWVACDGGVYENKSDGKGWITSNKGYHTQHVQSLDVYYDPDQTIISYATQDNGAWYGKWPDWKQTPVANSGDVNFSDGDPASAGLGFYYGSMNRFMLASMNGTKTAYSSDVPNPVATFIDPRQPDTPGLIQFIKGIKGENDFDLDALLIVHRPVRSNTDPPLPIAPLGGLEGIEKSGNPWLLRNKHFAEEPDFYKALAKGNWIKELDDLPNETYRVLVANGHGHPHYFAIVSQGTNGQSALFERRIRPRQKPKWEAVFNGIIQLTNACTQWEGWYGPVFVNPYDASKVYLLAADGVKVSHRDRAGNLVFTHDDVLTMLISASHTYPLVRQFCSGNPSNVLIGQRMLGNCTLGQVSFNRDAPKQALVSSPFTGVFYNDGSGKWRSFANLLPRGPVWAASMDGGEAYIGFAGRSVGMVDNIGSASLATYFTRVQRAKPNLGGSQSVIARLNISDGTVAANNQVSCRIIGSNGKTIFWGPSLHLNGQGEVLVPLFPLPQGCVVHLHFTGSKKEGVASSEYHFVN